MADARRNPHQDGFPPLASLSPCGTIPHVGAAVVTATHLADGGAFSPVPHLGG